MKRRKKLMIMGALLGLTLCLTLGVFFMDHRMEAIKESGETILSIPSSSVTELSWDHEGEQLSFQKEEETWKYTEDPDFPVSALELSNMLDPFESLQAAFRIEKVEDYSQYGLAEPECTISITADGQDYEIKIGAYSKMDQQRYVDIGDGNAYLLFHDPMMEFDQGLRDVIQNDDIPYLDEAKKITFSGKENYSILRKPEGGKSHRDEDLYFGKIGDPLLPLSTETVESYLSNLTLMGLSNYQTYKASQEDLSKWGLDAPELSIQVDYLQKTDDKEEEKSFILHLARDPEGRKKAEKNPENADPVPVYARVNDSELIYEITPAEYDQAAACGYNDLRHREIFPASTEDVISMEVTMDGSTSVFESREGEKEEDPRIFSYAGAETDITPVLTALRSLHAEEFTAEKPEGKLELKLKAGLASGSQVDLELYRKDGEHCLALVDGQVIGLVQRSQMVELSEKILAITLTPPEVPETSEETK